MKMLKLIDLRSKNRAKEALLVVPGPDGRYVGRKVTLENPVAAFQQACAWGAIDALDMELVQELRRAHGRAA